MKRFNEKVFIGFIGLVLAVAFFVVCNTVGKKTDKVISKDSDGQGWKADTTPITFDWYIDFSWFTTKWGTNPVSKYVTKKTGVNLNFMIPSGDETEKLNAMIDTGKLPDFITLSAGDDGYKRVIQSGLALPLDKLADKYDMYFTKVADKEKLDWYKQDDGHVYCYPNFSSTVTDESWREEKPSNQTFLVRKDIYEAIGKPDMRTPEGFLNALEKAKKLFPMVNGQELIPIGFHEFTDYGNLSLGTILLNFLAIPWEKDGKIYDREMDPEYIRWLKTLREANERGLLSKDIFIDKRAQMEENVTEGRYFALLYQSSDMAAQQLKLYSKNKNQIYMAVDGPANSKLEQPKLSGDSISGWTVTLISKTCKDPQRAIRFLSYLISEEGNRDLYLGVKGLTWDEVNGKEQFKPEVLDLLNKDRIAFDNKYGAANTYWMLADDNLQEKWTPPNAEPIKEISDWASGKTYNYSLFDDISPYGSTEEGMNLYRINSKWQSTLKDLLIAGSDSEFDSILKEFNTYRSENGWDKIQEYKQRRYEENKKKLNLVK
ncbi:extracellular solute-binding protein [Clostridium sp. C8-1-8]|uniref:extracellular solute-binding protein n=1 Tax=Clostridium sp. C8-1-8 TaxID=2698831 RepID=UPI00136EAF1B|nr:extracellular solute-binding protein [Clostridium sp. C8-1-8]